MTAILLAALTAAAPAPADDKGKKVEYTVHAGHFEKNTAGLKGDASFLLIGDRDTFDKYFGVARVMGPKPDYVPEKAFDKLQVVAVVHRGNAPYSYAVDGVTAAGNTLTVAYKATPGPVASSTFASPLILTVAKGVKKVVFVENGKEAGTAEAK